MHRPKPAMTALNLSMKRAMPGTFAVWVNPSIGWSNVWTGTTFTLQQDRFRPANIRTKPSASGWRSPQPFSGTYETWTPTLAGVAMTESIVGRDSPQLLDKIDNGGNSPCGKISLIMPSGSMLDRAIIKALAKLKDQKVNLSVAFGERRQAASMMGKTVIGIAKSVRQFKNANPKDWARLLRSKTTGHNAEKKIPEKWLELQYGWKPAMSDLYGAVEALNGKERDGDAYRATVKAVVRETFSEEFSLPYNGRMYVTGTKSGERGISIRLDYVLENPLLATLAQLGITNPAVLAWELVPYSFVVDWMIPIGSYLNSLDAALGWSFKGGSYTAFSKQHSSGYAKMGPSDVWNRHMIAYPSDYMSEQFKFTRTVFPSSPLPRFPGIKNPLSTGHLANAMSLLVTAFR